MFGPPNTDSLKCPITCELFRDPVTGQDGHTYERDAIVAWLQKNVTSPMTREPMTIESLRPNHIIKQLIDEFQSSAAQKHFLFKLDVDIKKSERRPIFQAPGKTIFKAEWIVKRGPPVVLLRIEGAKAQREASFYVQLGCHPHIVHTYGMVENELNSLMLVQEYATEGDLAELLKEKEFRPSQSVLVEIFLQIIDAMIYLANYGIVHGDLACRNVLVFRFNHSEPEGNLVKLTDFGLTRASSLYSVVGSTASTTLVLIPIRYVAPEILRSAGLSNYSEKSDVYSMGVSMWEACSQGQLPYALIEDENEVRRCKLKGKILTKPDNCDEALWNIIIRCWHQQPEERPTFKMLKQLLSKLQMQLVLGSSDEQENDIQNTVTDIIDNTIENHRQPLTPTSFSSVTSSVPKADTYIDNALSNENPSTTMSQCDFCNEHLPGFGRLIHDQTLTTLDLSSRKIDDIGTQHLADVLQDHKELTILNLNENTIGQNGIRYLAKAVRNNKVLINLELACNQIGDVGAQYLAEAIRNDQAPQKFEHLVNQINERDARILAAAAQSNKTLAILNLGSNQIGPTGAKHLAKALRNNQTLISLNLSGNQIGHTGAQYLAKALRNNQTLKKLDLPGNQIGAVGAQYIAETLPYNQTLTELDFSWNQIGNTGTQYFAEALRNNQTLTTLNLGSNKISAIGAQHFAEMLRNNQTLTMLNFWGNQIGDDGVQYFTEMLRTNQTLTWLNLCTNHISDTGAQYLAEVLRINQTLTILDLCTNQIGVTGLQHLSETLRHNQTLTTLYLQHNQIGDSGAQHLAETLRNNRILTTLNISGNQIGNAGAQCLADALRNNQTLTTLKLGNNQIGDAGVQHLAEALPSNQTLTTLNLEKNQIGDTGAGYIFEALRFNQTLITLNLDWDKISDRCSKSLNDALKNRQTPRNVCLDEQK